MSRLIDENEYQEKLARVPMELRTYRKAVEVALDMPTVKAIPEADYENRLKADMVAMLEQLDSEIQEQIAFMGDGEEANGMKEADNLIKDKINDLIDNQPTVKAIPLDRVEQIREEILNYLDSREKVANDEWVSYEISEMRKYIQDKFKGVSDGRN